MKYYPARLAGEFETVAEALKSVGLTAEQTVRATANATINQSESVFVDFKNGKGLATTKLKNGQFGLWQACIDPLFDTPEEANELAVQIDAGLGEMKGSTWAVFEWREPPSRASH